MHATHSISSDPASNFGIADSISGAIGAVSGAIGGALSAKSNMKASMSQDKANIAMSHDARTGQLSNTTQTLIKANEEKQRNKQRTQITLLVVVVLTIGVLAFIVTKDDKK